MSNKEKLSDEILKQIEEITRNFREIMDNNFLGSMSPEELDKLAVKHGLIPKDLDKEKTE